MGYELRAFNVKNPSESSTWARTGYPPGVKRNPLLLGLLGTTLLVGGAVGAFFWTRVPDAACPDATSCDAVDRALTPRPDLPLDTAHTDVVLAIVCTFRKDRVQPWGNPRPTAPFLGALARSGVLFERTIVQAPWTRPSVGSLITGRYPAQLKLDDPSLAASSYRPRPDDALTLAEILGREGYATVGASANPNVSRLFGFGQGFDVFQEPDVLWRNAGPADLPAGDVVGAEVLAALDALPSPTRVFLQALFVDTHEPRKPTPQAKRVLKASPEKGTPKGVKRVDRYDAAVRTVDSHLARLFVGLQARRPNLLFLVVGDHGEGLRLPESHGIAHGNYLFTSSTDVPFVTFHPAVPSPGRRIGGLATGLDVVPTVLDLLHVPAPAGLEGVTEAPAILGATDTAAHREAYSQTWFRRSDRSALVMTLGDTTWHLLHDNTADGKKAFDLYDPDRGMEEHDLAAFNPDVVDDLSRRLMAWETRMRAAATEGPAPVQAAIPAETNQKLQAMGYMD